MAFTFDSQKEIPFVAALSDNKHEIIFTLPEIGGEDTFSINVHPAGTVRFSGKIGRGSGNSEAATLDEFVARNPVNSMVSTVAQYLKENQADIDFLGRTTLIDADMIRKTEEIELAFWEEIRRSRMDKDLAAELNEIFKINIKDLALIPSQSPRPRPDRGGERRVSVKLTASLEEFTLNMDSYGEGVRDALSVLIFAASLEGTMLLMEEPEAHFHPEAMSLILRNIVEIAKRNNLQLFITTHNLETLNAITKLSKDVATFHLNLEKDGNLQVRVISGPDAKLLSALGTDVRSLSGLFSYLIVEGPQDITFLESILKKTCKRCLADYPLEKLQVPKDQQQEHLKTLALTGKRIILFRDYDADRDADKVVGTFVGSLKSIYGEKIQTENDIIKISDTGSQIKIIPVGLPGDADLESVGINRFAMEDYLLKLLCIDEPLKKWASITLKELRDRADKLREVGGLNTSKSLLAALQFMKNLRKEELVETMVANASSESVSKLTSSIVAELEK